MTDQPKVLNINTTSREDAKGAVFIGRPGKWGNPFRPGTDGTREEVLRKYRLWLDARPDLVADLVELRGKNLLCFCAPKLCHGDVLMELANKEE